jgi:hypothetical protein
MSRTFAAAVLLATLAMLLPGKAPAGPPEGASGKMAFDRVGAGLDRYRRERDLSKQLRWLERLAPSGDPRVGVALGEYVSDDNPHAARQIVALLLLRHFVPAAAQRDYFLHGPDTGHWWRANEADLRRRAAQLPR